MRELLLASEVYDGLFFDIPGKLKIKFSVPKLYLQEGLLFSRSDLSMLGPQDKRLVRPFKQPIRKIHCKDLNGNKDSRYSGSGLTQVAEAGRGVFVKRLFADIKGSNLVVSSELSSHPVIRDGYQRRIVYVTFQDESSLDRDFEGLEKPQSDVLSFLMSIGVYDWLNVELGELGDSMSGGYLQLSLVKDSPGEEVANPQVWCSCNPPRVILESWRKGV